MEKLIETYSIQEIIFFLVLLAPAIKGIVSFYDWAKDRLGKMFKKENDQANKMGKIQSQMDDSKKAYEVLKTNQIHLQDQLNHLTDQITLLVQSDKDDIKSFITERHHNFCYREGWIDDYSLDCIMKRYEHYKEEGGNSFIAELIQEINDLPRRPPEKEK